MRKMCFGSSPKALHGVHGASPCDLTRNAAGWPLDPRKSLHRQPCGSRPAWRRVSGTARHVPRPTKGLESSVVRQDRAGLFTQAGDPAELTPGTQNLPCAHMLRNKLGSMFLTSAKKEVVLSLMYLDLTLDQEKKLEFSNK